MNYGIYEFSNTLSYYNYYGEDYAKATENLETYEAYQIFEQYLPEGARILDLGCGSGRDSSYFLSKGYQVISIDGSKTMCEIASKRIGKAVICSLIEDLEIEGKFHGIWANAVVHHMGRFELSPVFEELSGFLLPKGVIFATFPYGKEEGFYHGMTCTYLQELDLYSLCYPANGLKLQENGTFFYENPYLPQGKWLYFVAQRVEVRQFEYFAFHKCKDIAEKTLGEYFGIDSNLYGQLEIKDLYLTNRCLNMFARQNLHTVKDLFDLTFDEIRALPYFGQKSQDDMIEGLVDLLNGIAYLRKNVRSDEEKFYQMSFEQIFGVNKSEYGQIPLTAIEYTGGKINLLINANIRTVEDLLGQSEKSICNIHGFGYGSMVKLYRSVLNTDSLYCLLHPEKL